jgi:hypothetical protein
MGSCALFFFCSIVNMALRFRRCDTYRARERDARKSDLGGIFGAHILGISLRLSGQLMI